MATPTYELGDIVTVKVNGFPYLGTIMTYDESTDPIIYKISIGALGNVISLDENSDDFVE